MTIIALEDDYEAHKRLDKHYREWIQTQVSALSQIFGEFTHFGEGRNDAAHYKHSGNSGTGHKPLFSCLPLTHKEHMRQHGTNYASLEKWEWWERKVALHQIRFERETGHKIPEKYRLEI